MSSSPISSPLDLLDRWGPLLEIVKSNHPSKALDLGCGYNPKNPFNADELFGVDIIEVPEKYVSRSNLAVEPIPFPDNNFDFVTAFDFIEHIPRVLWYEGRQINPFIEIMNEIWRVLKPHGIFFHGTPGYPSTQVFQDPTHVNFITLDTMPSYFCKPSNWAKLLGYGFYGEFSLIDQHWIEPHIIAGLMSCVK